MKKWKDFCEGNGKWVWNGFVVLIIPLSSQLHIAIFFCNQMIGDDIWWNVFPVHKVIFNIFKIFQTHVSREERDIDKFWTKFVAFAKRQVEIFT